ncbi:MAG: MFS transporter [bacterium]|nr:MFS transporter [bacterium]
MSEKQCSVSSSRGRGVIVAAILASGLAFLIGTAISVALPAIQAEFSASINQIQWVINANILALSSLLLIGGSLGDNFGRKKIFMIGIAVFGSGSFLAGFSNSISQLIGFQALAGVGAAMMVPGSLTIINVSIKEEERGRAIGLWSGYSAGLAVFGPLLGGFLVENFGWRYVFFLVVPVALVSLIITARNIFESRNEEIKKLDWAGTIAIGLALFGLAYGLVQGSVLGWQSPIVLGSILVGIVSLIAFVLIERKAQNPVVPLAIFKSPLVSAANIVTLFLYFALQGMIFFLVLNFQQIQGYSPTFAGLGMLPPIILITFLSGPAGILADRIGPRLPMILGPILVGIGMMLIGFVGINSNYWVSFFPGLVLFGAGMALVIAPLTKSALDVEPKYSGSASGVNNSVSRVAGLLAIAILGVFMLSTFQNNLDTELSETNLNTSEYIAILSQSDKLGGIEIPEYFTTDARSEAKFAISRSFDAGFQKTMFVSAALAFLSSLVAATAIHNKKMV